MQKKGVNSIFRRGVAHLLFLGLLVYVIGMSFLHPEFFGEGSITGHAVYSGEEAQQKIETALATASFMSSINSANICIQIRDEDEEHVFKVRKTPTGLVVSDSIDYCDGQTREDFVIKFVSYDAFSEVMDSFTVPTLIAGKGGNKFYILSSKVVKTGGDVVCNDAFKLQFCGALSSFGPAEDLIAGDLQCCVDTFTKDQKKLLQEHLTETGFANELAPTEEAPGISFSTMPIFLAIIGALVLLGGGVIAMKRKPSKPAGATAKKPAASVAVPTPVAQEDPKFAQLKQYVEGTIKAGYSRNDVYQYVLKQGWQKEMVDKVFLEVSAETPSVQTPQQPQA